MEKFGAVENLAQQKITIGNLAQQKS